MQHDTPIHHASARQFDRAAHLGEGGKQQVGTDCQVGFDVEEEDQDRRHQGAAADTREPDHQANKKTSKNKRHVMHGCRL